MRLKRLLLLCAFYQCVIGSPTTEKVEILTPQYINEDVEKLQDISTKSITDMVLQQTEVIKKIISEQQVPPKLSEDVKVNNDFNKKSEVENESIEELKKKCQQLSRIFNSAAGIQPEPDASTETPRTVTVEAFGPQVQPDFLRYKPKFPSPPPINMPQPPQMSGNYFIFTQNPEMYGTRINKITNKMDTAASSVEEDIVYPPEDVEYDDEEESAATTTTTTHSPELPESSEVETTTLTLLSTPNISLEIIPTKPKYKYVRLEPIVLKKVLLPTGKTSLYWYRLLPTTQSFVQIPDTPETENVKVVAQPQNYNKDVLLPAQYQFYLDPQSGTIQSNALIKPTMDMPTSTTTSTTTEKPKPTPRPQFFINPQTGMIYQSGLPHQFIYHKRVPEYAQPQPQPQPPPTTTTTTTTTEKIPLPTYTIDIPQPEEKPAESFNKKQFKHEFRFVIPMVVTGTQDELSNYPYQLDPYAYLPKGQRPATMNVPVPYVPNYQMIRTLTIPNKLQEVAAKKEA